MSHGITTPLVYSEGARSFCVVDHDAVYNVRTGEQIGRIDAKLRVWERHFSLNPEGMYYAIGTDGLNPDVHVTVVSTQSQKVVQRYKVRSIDGNARLTFLRFAGPQKIVAAFLVESVPVTIIINLAAGASEKIIPGLQLHNGSAVNHDGTRIVTGTFKHLSVFDLKGQRVATLESPPFATVNSPTCAGIAFSQDGSEISACVGSKLTVWNSTGRILKTFGIPAGLTESVGKFPGNAIQWIPDRSGWLLAGTYLLDRSSEEFMWRSPNARSDSVIGTSIVDTKTALVFIGNGLKTMNVDRERIALPKPTKVQAGNTGKTKTAPKTSKPTRPVVGF